MVQLRATHKSADAPICNLGPEPTPSALADISDMILDHPAFNHIAASLMHARDLGFDPMDPDIVRRAIDAGEKSLAAANERAGLVTSYERIKDEPYAAGRHSPIIYYLRMDDVVKIGTSINLASRLQQLSARGVVAVEPGDRARECARHVQFSRLRIRQEWFRMDADLAEHIVALRRTFEERCGQSVDEWVDQQTQPRRNRTRLPIAPPGRQGRRRNDGLLTTVQAAQLVRVGRDAVNHWRRTGHLLPVAISAGGRQLFAADDVLRVAQEHDSI